MSGESSERRLQVVVGAGGVGKTTVAAALGLNAARAGRDTLVMTFDPSLRLKDALGVGEEARRRPVRVALDAPGQLWASLLDARGTFDALVERYAPDEPARRRVLDNRLYRHLAGRLSGVLEYMAVERLFEVAADERYRRIVLDTPPTAQALDFLEAPARILGFLDSGATRLAMRPWFDEQGRLRPTARLGFVGRRLDRMLDEMVGLDLLRDMAEFFQAFGPLYAGFRERAGQVQELLRSADTEFVLVAGPGRERIPETLFFARHLAEAGYRLGELVVNRVHPRFGDLEAAARDGGADDAGSGAPGRDAGARAVDGRELLRWLGHRDHAGLAELRALLSPQRRPIHLPLLPDEPVDLPSLSTFGLELERRLARAANPGGAG